MSSQRNENTEHLDTTQILAYVAGKVSYDKLVTIGTHLAACQQCAGRVAAHRAIRQRFDELWETWTASAQREELVTAWLGGALARASVRPDLRGRVKAWLSDVPRRVLGALGVVLDASERAAQLVEGRAVGWLAFSPVPAPVAVHGDDTAPRWVSLEAAGPPQTRVTVDPVLQRLTIRTELIDEPWPLVVLIPKREGVPVVHGFRRPEGEDFLLAEFDDVPSGEYVLVVEKT